MLNLFRFRHSLAGKLTILICIVGLVPLYAATYYFYVQSKEALEQTGRMRLERIFRNSKDTLDRTIENTATDLKILAGFPLFREERKRATGGLNWLEEEHKALKGLKVRHGDLVGEACVIDRSGKEISRITQEQLAQEDELDNDETDRPFFDAGFKTEPGKVFIGSPYISHDSRRWVVPMATPIVNLDGTKLALLHFEINLDAVGRSIAAIEPEGHRTIFIVDNASHLLISTEGGAAADVKPFAGSLKEQFIEQNLPVATITDPAMKKLLSQTVLEQTILKPVRVMLHGVQSMALAGALPRFGENQWYLVASLPEDEILAGLHTWRYLALVAVATILLGLTAFLIGRNISRPIVDLYNVTMKIATGELDVEVPTYHRIDELGAFNAAFKAMMGGIRALVSNLQQSSRELHEAKASVERRNQEMIIKNLELLTHRQELQRRNEALTEITTAISDLIIVAAEKESFDIRYNGYHEVRCWEIMEGCDPACPAYGSTTYTCRSKGGGPCCRDEETGAAPSIRQCIQCPVYKVSHPDEMSVVGENFNIMMDILQGESQELDETRKQLIQSEKMSSIGQLAAGVAHEINNPIGFISSNMSTLVEYTEDLKELIKRFQSIREKIVTCDPAIQEEFEQIDEFWKSQDLDFVLEDLNKLVKESLDGAKRVAGIVKNLKEFSHVDEAEWKASDINEGIESTLSIIWNELKYKATVIKEYGDIPPVECYPMQLNQVFMNLLVNAAQAIPERGEIKIKTWQEDGFAYITIGDTGTGIPDNLRAKIFNPFFTTKAVGKGTGLGLSIAYGIIEKHKGTIILDSKEGIGTTFTIKIPQSAKPNGVAA